MANKKITDTIVSESLADMYKFIDINMKRMGDIEDSKLAIVMMAAGFKGDIEDDYLRGVSVGLMLASLVIEYCEKKVN